MNTRTATFRFLAGLLAVSSSLLATAPESSFLERSELVFVGRVVDIKSETSRDGRLILTHYYFSVEEMLKGQPLEVVGLTELGGTHEGITLTVTHSATYSPDCLYLVFATRDEAGRMRTLNGPDGRFWIAEDSRGRKGFRVSSGHPLSRFFSINRSRLVSIEELKAKAEKRFE